MEYTLHNLGKSFQKRRVHIMICLSLCLMGVVAGVTLTKNKKDIVIVEPISEITETSYIKNFTIVKTYERPQPMQFT